MRGCKWSLVINVTTEDSSPDIVINNLEANNLYKTKFAAFNEKGLCTHIVVEHWEIGDV